MKKILFAAAILASVCVCADAAKKDKNATQELLFGIKSGVVTMSNENMSNFGGGMRGGMGGGMQGMGNMQGMMGGMQGMQGMGGGMRGGQNAQAGQNAQGGENRQNRQRQMNFDPSQIVTKIYFDDYGRKIATVTQRGEAGSTRVIVVDGATVTINEAENTATKMAQTARQGGNAGGMMGGMMGGAGNQIKPAFDYANLDAKTIKKNKIRELGQEEVAGVLCDLYSIRTSNQGYSTEQTVWIYKNITMKSEQITDWGTTGQTVKSLEECEVPASMFTIPEGCQVTERQMRGMGGFGGGNMGGGDFGGGMGGGMGGMQGGMGGFGGF